MFAGFTELFDFYAYAVFTIFGFGTQSFFPPNPPALTELYPTLREAVQDIRIRYERGLFACGVFYKPSAPLPASKSVACLLILHFLSLCVPQHGFRFFLSFIS